MKKNFLLPLLFCSYCAHANDGIASVGVGGIQLQKTNDIAMKKEVLNVSWNKISVDYEFLNESSKDREETIVFPLPAYSSQNGYFEQYYGEPNKFTIKVDGKVVSYNTIIEAFIDNKNITKELKKIDLTDEQIGFFPIASPFNVKVKPISKQQLLMLKKYNYVNNESDSGELVPIWNVKVTYQWKQIFPSGKIIHVNHSYTPFVSSGPGYDLLVDNFKTDYCADKTFYQAHNRISKRNENNYIVSHYVDYILTTGNTWKNGIEDFTLNLIKKSPQEIVSLCFPSQFKKINDTTLQVKIKNFNPKNDLAVYFGNITFDSKDEDFNNAGNPPKIK